MKTPKGKVEFAYYRFDDLPYGAEEVKTFMVPGESCIYVVPISSYRKNEMKNEDDLIQIE